MGLEFRKVFDTIPDQFDTYRPRYCAELFADLIEYAGIGPGKTVLELGPGTGQATGPILDTGCGYHAIELGEHLAETMKRKYGGRPNFHLIHDDFITHDFGSQTFDVIYSAATIQWIPEKIAFSKTFELLNPGGTLAMMLTKSDYKTPNEALYQSIQRSIPNISNRKPHTCTVPSRIRTRLSMDMPVLKNGNMAADVNLPPMNTWPLPAHIATTS